jgi:hypothetical protein
MLTLSSHDEIIPVKKLSLSAKKDKRIITKREIAQSDSTFLSWRNLDSPSINFGSLPGDIYYMWFNPQAEVKLISIRVWNIGDDEGYEGDSKIDVWKTNYQGEIVNLNHVGKNPSGFIGYYDTSGVWVPGTNEVFSQSLVTEKLWGPHIYTFPTPVVEGWHEIHIDTLQTLQTDEPFIVSIENQTPIPDKWGRIGAEQATRTPYHFFKAYADDEIPNAIYIRQYSMWIEVFVEYLSNPPPQISVAKMNNTYNLKPILKATAIDHALELQNEGINIFSGWLFWSNDGGQTWDSTTAAIEGDSEAGYTLQAEIPIDLTVGEITYYFSCEDLNNSKGSSPWGTFQVLRPNNPDANILLIRNYPLISDEEYTSALVASGVANTDFEIWNIEDQNGIDGSVINWGWRNIFIDGWNFDSFIETRDSDHVSPFRTFKNSFPNGRILLMDRDYFINNYEPEQPVFGPGDLAYDFFGIESGENDPESGWYDSVFTFIALDQFFGTIGQTLATDHTWADYVNPRSDGGTAIAVDESGNNVAIRFEDGNWKAVYLAFSGELTDKWNEIANSVLRYFDLLGPNLITFQVDMSKKMIKSEFQSHFGDQVVVRGNFNGWVSNDNLLSDADIDSIYTGTFNVGFSAGDTLSYKFVMLHPEDRVTWEHQNDRTFILTGSAETLPVVYFSNDSSSQMLQSYTDFPSNISMSTVKLNGRIVPNGYDTYVGFDYGETESYGNLVTADQSPVSGTNEVSVTATVSGLNKNTTYHFRVRSSNTSGSSTGEDRSFTTLQSEGAPAAITSEATNVTENSADLNGVINPNGSSTEVIFQYGLTTSFGDSLFADQSPITGISNVIVSVHVIDLIDNTNYHFRVKAKSDSGTSYGVSMSFKTNKADEPPTASTNPATQITSNSAVLNGLVNSNSLSTDVFFQYGTTTSYGDSIIANPNPVTGVNDVTVSAELSGLSESTTYYFRVKAKNSAGTTFGVGQSFMTGQSSGAPLAITASASTITEISATLNGTVNPNNLSTDVLFYYGNTITYGDSTFANQSPVSGASNLPVSTALSNLTPDADYYYKVVAVNSIGRTHGTNHQFHTLADTQFPVVNAVSNPTATLTQDATIIADITDNAGLASVFIKYRIGGETSFVEQQMEFDGSAYSAQIPNNILSDRGVEYYIKATDFGDNSSNSNRYMLKISIPNNAMNFNYSGGTSQNAYRMISIPLAITNPTIQNVLLDDFGASDKSRWRLFREVNDQYYEHPNTGDFTAGRAFWLICTESVIIDIPEGHTVFAEDNFEISLPAGWNQIGLPFNYSIAWQDIIETSNNPNINGPYLYQGTYSIPSILEPYKGYYVNNLENHTITLNIPLWGNGADLLKSAGDLEKWQIKISAKVKSAKDDLTMAGVSSSAQVKWDRNDFLEPPPVGDYISVYFPHPDWEKYPGNYAIDMRNYSEEGHYWDFGVKTNVNNSEIELLFPTIKEIYNTTNLSQNFDLFVIDPQLHIAHNLKSNNKFYIPTPPKDKVRYFRLIIGKEDFIISNNMGVATQPLYLMLFQNYPNPFNSNTSIIYTLPQDTRVSLIIYNLLGEKVKTFHSNHFHNTGYYTVYWDGNNDLGKSVASGVYIYQLRSEFEIKTKKMVLIR